MLPLPASKKMKCKDVSFGKVFIPAEYDKVCLPKLKELQVLRVKLNSSWALNLISKEVETVSGNTPVKIVGEMRCHACTEDVRFEIWPGK